MARVEPLPDTTDEALMELIERVWSKVTIKGPDECWPWTGTLDSRKYGVIKLRAHPLKPKMVKAHRLMYLFSGGDISDFVLHRCNNPICCNPAHLYKGNHGDNMKWMSECGRSTKGRKNVWKCHTCKEFGHNSRGCGKKTVYRCSRCKRLGHIITSCKK